MKALLTLFVIAGLGYGLVYFIPSEAKKRALASLGLSQFFGETLPHYLREKFRIPPDPAKTRRKLLEDLATTITSIERELEGVVPVTTNGEPAKLPREEAIRAGVEKSRELLAKSEDVLRELTEANTGAGVVRTFAGRLRDKVLPPPAECPVPE